MRLHFGRRAAATLVVVLGIGLRITRRRCCKSGRGLWRAFRDNLQFGAVVPASRWAMQRRRRCRHLRKDAGLLHAGFAAGVRLQRQDLSERMRIAKGQGAVRPRRAVQNRAGKDRRRPEKASAAQALTSRAAIPLRRLFQPTCAGLTRLSATTRRAALFSGRVLFSGHLLCWQQFLCSRCRARPKSSPGNPSVNPRGQDCTGRAGANPAHRPASEWRDRCR